MWELCLILLVGLIVLGPRQLAEVAKVLGKVYRDIQNMSWDFRRSIDQELKSTSQPSQASYTPPDTSQAAGPDSTAILPGERSGPDFYADLLEQASEKDEQAAAEKDETMETAAEPHPQDSEDTEKVKDVPKEGKQR